MKIYGRYSIRTILLLAIVAASQSQVLTAQETKVVRDLQLWTGAAIEKSWKDWSLTLNEDIRFKKNISEINNYFTEAGLRPDISLSSSAPCSKIISDARFSCLKDR